jgi:hypothetical protein
MLNGLPWDWPLMRQVLRKHALLFSLLVLMGASFSIAGGLVAWYLGNGLIFGLIFLVSGLGILGFAFISNYSSCLYYYEQQLLNKYGKHTLATITQTFINNTPVQTGPEIPTDLDEIYLSIAYRFTLLGKPYQGASIVNEFALFNAINIGMQVPILVMQNHPSVTRLQATKLKAELNPKTTVNQEQNKVISQPLLE